MQYNMADIEKVIKGLECCRQGWDDADNNSCQNCPYSGEYGCPDKLKTDALELLKEHKRNQ